MDQAFLESVGHWKDAEGPEVQGPALPINYSIIPNAYEEFSSSSQSLSLSPSPFQSDDDDDEEEEEDTIPEIPIQVPKVTSRAVWITKLPECISLAQIMQVVRAPSGGVISIDMYKVRECKECLLTGEGLQEGSDGDTCDCSESDIGPCCIKTTPRCARIEFRHACDAENFFRYWAKILGFLDAANVKHMVNMSLLVQPVTDTYKGFISRHNDFLLKVGCTRTLEVKNVPNWCVWFIISVCHLPTIVDVEYYWKHTLRIEFKSLTDAHRAYRNLFKDEIPWFTSNSTGSGRDYRSDAILIDFIPDVATGSWLDFGDWPNPWAHIPSDHIEKRFNTAPYNEEWPEVFSPIMSYAKLPVRNKEADPRTPSAEQQQLNNNLEQVNARYKRTPMKWSWEFGNDFSFYQDVGKDDYQEALDIFFKTPRLGLFNLASFNQYSRVAAHRRERCATEGLPSWGIPSCEDCAFGCRQAREPTGPPRVILDYINPQDDNEDAEWWNS